MTFNQLAYLVLRPPIDFWPGIRSIPKPFAAGTRSDWLSSLPIPDAGGVIYGEQKFGQRVALGPER